MRARTGPEALLSRVGVATEIYARLVTDLFLHRRQRQSRSPANEFAFTLRRLSIE
ncbi:MAG: hypothetical protein AAGH78_00390 [Cyanobacteria bacterium P01_H01_bin.58]